MVYIKNPNRKNILSGLSNLKIISGFVVIVGAIYGFGNYLGKLEKDREIFKIEQQFEEEKSKNLEWLKKFESLENKKSDIILKDSILDMQNSN